MSRPYVLLLVVNLAVLELVHLAEGVLLDGYYEYVAAVEYPDRKYIDPKIVVELECVDCLMKAANRSYFITEGTLLGTVRDGFFLPWDGDGDIVFDVENSKNELDYDGFYKIFSPGPIGTGNYQKCPKCNQITSTLFLPARIINGVEMNLWQSYNDVLTGSLASLHGPTKHQAPDAMHKQLLQDSRNTNPARIQWNPDPEIRWAGHGYIDFAPFEVFDTGSKVEVREHPFKYLKYDDVFPLVDCKAMSFGQNETRSVDLRCPKDPRRYLDQVPEFKGNWVTPPYNVYDDHKKKWTRVGDRPLAEFVRKMYKYTGLLQSISVSNDGDVR